MLTLLDDGVERPLEVRVDGDRVWVPAGDVERALGWVVKAEGLCRGETCVVVRDRAALLRDGDVELGTLASALDRPLALDVAEGAAALGGSAAERGAALASLDAPAFTLPDLDGRPHALADHRGRKALLLAWAGW